MSRIGLKPIEIPEGVEVTLDGNTATVKGSKGTLTKDLHADIKVNIDDKVITFERPTEGKEHRSLHGTTRSLLNNMVVGVSKGYEKELEIIGVGYRAALQGQKLVVSAGYAHPAEIEHTECSEFNVPNNTQVSVTARDE